MVRANITFWLLISLCGHSFAQEKRPDPAVAAEQAVRKGVEAYIAAFNKGDAPAVAALFTEDAEYINDRDEVVRGRPAIEKQVGAFFQANPGAKVAIDVQSVRLVSPDVAVEHGAVQVTLADGAVSVGEYTAVNVRREGKWRIASLRETVPPPPPAPDEPLADLAWMVGEWIDQSAEDSIHTVCRWTTNRRFLTRSFTISVQGRPEVDGTEVIGWDPAAKAVRSWYFDSDGGFGEGQWTRDGDRWTVKSSGTLPDGGTASAVHVFTRLDDNSFSWKSTSREVDGELQPDVEEAIVVRVGSAAPRPAHDEGQRRDAPPAADAAPEPAPQREPDAPPVKRPRRNPPTP
jgi:uncharacterized protein (TIGR02246 family)